MAGGFCALPGTEARGSPRIISVGLQLGKLLAPGASLPSWADTLRACVDSQGGAIGKGSVYKEGCWGCPPLNDCLGRPECRTNTLPDTLVPKQASQGHLPECHM